MKEERQLMTTIRLASIDDAAALAEVHVAAWRESYGALLPKAMLARLSSPIRAERWRRMLSDPARPRVYLAEQEGWIVGFVDGGRCRDRALAQDMEIYELYLLDAVKRQGIGGRLLKAVVHDFLAEGAVSAGVWALGDNHSARAFYERFGAEPVAEKVERLGDFDVHEVGYAWRDLRRVFSP
jgi:GNAT superfamily N-acetyltransferase